MTEPELMAYIKDHPEALTVFLGDGWRRIHTIPLYRSDLYFLREDGSTYGPAGASNAAFLVDPKTVIGWRREKPL